MPQVTPYKIHILDSKLQRLQQKLELTDFPQHEIEDAGWKYGTPVYFSFSLFYSIFSTLYHLLLPPTSMAETPS
jgi:hypothetical protein